MLDRTETLTGLETGHSTGGEVPMLNNKAEIVVMPSLVARNRRPLSPEIRRAIAAVREPLQITRHTDGDNKTWVVAAGVPRAGVDAAFARRVAAHTRLTLAKAVIGCSVDIAYSNYLFTHPDDADGELGSIVENAIDSLRREAVELPVPSAGSAVQVNARLEPAGANPLVALLGALEAASGSEPVHILSLSGRRYYLGRPDAQWGFEIQAVVTLPRGRADDAALTRQLQNHLAAREAGWTSDARGYTGTFIDTFMASFDAADEPDEPVVSYARPARS